MHLGGLDMGLTKYKFGELIELTNEKNANGLYGEDDAIGVNIDKIIMPMRGNLEKKEGLAIGAGLLIIGILLQMTILVT